MHEDPQANVKGSDVFFKILRGVRQGCVLGPALFGLLFEFLLRLSGLEQDLGVELVIGAQSILDTPDGMARGRKFSFAHGEFADDIALVGSPGQLTRAMTRIQAIGEAIGLDISIGKTEWMWLAVPRPDIPYALESDPTQVFVGDQPIKHVPSFAYLGSKVSEDGQIDTELENRIGLARKALWGLSKVLRSSKLRISQKIKFAKTRVISTLLHGCESWTLLDKDYAKLEAFLNEVRLAIVDRKRLENLVVLENEELHRLCRLDPVRELIAKRRLAFLAATWVDPSCLLARDVIFCDRLGGGTISGRTRKTWEKQICLDIEYLSGFQKNEIEFDGLLSGLVDVRRPLDLNTASGACPRKSAKLRVKKFLNEMVKKRVTDLRPTYVSTRIRNEECGLCSAAFAERKELYRHWRTAHARAVLPRSASNSSAGGREEVASAGGASGDVGLAGVVSQVPPIPEEVDAVVENGALDGQTEGGVEDPASVGNQAPPVPEAATTAIGAIAARLKQFRCLAPLCEMAYTSLGWLKRHARLRHGAPEPEEDAAAVLAESTGILRDGPSASRRLVAAPSVMVGQAPPVPFCESRLSCPYPPRLCSAGGKVWGASKTVVNHVSAVHGWNWKGNKPKRVRRTKERSSGEDNDRPVGGQVATLDNRSGRVGDQSRGYPGRQEDR